jgi:hypothetical protein
MSLVRFSVYCGDWAFRLSCTAGLDIPALITKDLKLADAGIILKQTQLGFSSVSVEDIYGTINPAQALKLAADVLHIPGGLSIPISLPEIVVTFANASSSDNNSVCYPLLSTSSLAVDGPCVAVKLLLQLSGV